MLLKKYLQDLKYCMIGIILTKIKQGGLAAAYTLWNCLPATVIIVPSAAWLGWTDTYGRQRTHTDNSPITVSRRYRRHWLSVKVRKNPYMSVVPPSIRLPAKAVFIIACNHFLRHYTARRTSLPCRFLEFILTAWPLEKSWYFYYIIVRVLNNQPCKEEKLWTSVYQILE